MRKMVLAAAAIAALALVGDASAQSPIVIKFSHVVASDTPKGKAAEKFKEPAEKYTDGKVIEFTNEEIEKLQAEIARKLGYKLVDHRLELYCIPLDDDKS